MDAEVMLPCRKHGVGLKPGEEVLPVTPDSWQLQECVKSAALDLQVRALCAELSRAAQSHGDISRSVLPVLSGIESRLSQMFHLKAGR